MVYIGSGATQQTCGAGFHACSFFLPTMERTALDFSNRDIATWNKELLAACGAFARSYYIDEAQVLGGALPGALAFPPRSSFAPIAPSSSPALLATFTSPIAAAATSRSASPSSVAAVFGLVSVPFELRPPKFVASRSGPAPRPWPPASAHADQPPRRAPAPRAPSAPRR